MKTSPALTQKPLAEKDSSEPRLLEQYAKDNFSSTSKEWSEESLYSGVRVRHVQPGDTLSEIFQASEVPSADLSRIMEADAEYLSLETLKPGSELSFLYGSDGEFSGLALRLDAARKIAYMKLPDGRFEYQKLEKDTHWVSEVLRGRIDGSLYASALRSGLTRAQVLLIDQLLGSKLDFRRDLRAGDTFTVMVGHEMTDSHGTGNTRLEAVSLARGSRTLSAFLFDDGNYYNEKGESVTPAFLRWPTQKPFRVSSAFNQNRLHPITGRRSPHNGVDLATPTGTPIVSTGDGTVRRIGNHPYAGKYIDIDHGGAHATRYLHLHKVLVKKGAQVQRGQKIALSGNTGRSTGPHLHFELHINGRPVDPLTADIPTAASVPRGAIARFKEQLSEQLAIMKYAASRSELFTADTPSSLKPKS
ncbi:peptidoglycan DD-metalloendopeptidase family protein [Marinobacter salexigens]|uniref:Peptidoglycan DD-metalloendopeptidase family protein n=2 Tax=Marinobacter salexigens TaxID=1925763 RepID=A0ABS6A8P2_9GAMM|nr:peptidoglycan DD-metalloendopeptidase family protein [Marinobacter salexigens]